MRKAMKQINNVQEERENQKLSQEELAEMANVSIQTIRSIEKGKYKPSKSLSLVIAEQLNAEVTAIFPNLEIEK